MIDTKSSSATDGVGVDAAPAPSKRCPRCGETKAASEFHKNRSQADGLACQCKACIKGIQADDYRKHKARRDAVQKRYYEENREAIYARQRAYLKRNWDRLQPIRAEQCRDWRRRNPDKVRANTAKRQAKIRGARVEPVDLAAVLERDKGICYLCRAPINGTPHFDHIVALSQGGEHSYANIAATHPRCNMRKGGKRIKDLPGPWRERAERKLASSQATGG